MITRSSMAKLRHKRIRRKPLVYTLLFGSVFVIISLLLMASLHRSKGYEDSQRSIWQRNNPAIDIPGLDVEGRNLKGYKHELPSIIIDGVKASETDIQRNLPKTISFWNPSKDAVLRKTLLETDFSKCEYRCRMTENLNQSDAVIFWVDFLSKIQEEPSFYRKPGQLWVFKSIEAPSRFTYYSFLPTTSYNKLFNLTMTYHKESDIPAPFGKLVGRVPPKRNYDEVFNGKTKLVAFLTSYCSVRSGRMNYIKAMRKKTSVDIFGICEKKECGKDGPLPWKNGLDSRICTPMLSKHYKFLLAFETSLCSEYVTNVFFDAYKNIDIVPVVRGGSDYKGLFPADTFIDAADFTSPEALASFLSLVGQNKTRYLEYLRAKDKFTCAPDFPPWQCKLCRHLHTEQKQKTYRDMHLWWTRRACYDPGYDY